MLFVELSPDIQPEEALCGLTPFLDLPVARFAFSLAFQNKDRLPDYPSLGLRGLLGRNLHKLVCPFSNRPGNRCKACLLKSSCPYYMLYEQQSTLDGRFEATRGYIIYVAPFPKSCRVTMELTLFGYCSTLLPAIYAALELGGKTGLGLVASKKAPFTITGISQMTPTGLRSIEFKEIAEALSPFSLRRWLEHDGGHEGRTIAHLVTPLRLTKKYENTINWPLFYGNLARRLEGLHQFYNNGEVLGKERWQALKKKFDSWPDPPSRLRWTPLERFSGRQRQKVPLSGFTGEVEIRQMAKEQQAWWRVAALIHAGRSIVMGMGRVEIR